jgi:UDP-N-acetylenolpyruvoylglucosamine reductase
MQIQQNIDLKNYNTFKVKSIAKYFGQIQNPQDIIDLVDSPVYVKNKKYFL